MIHDSGLLFWATLYLGSNRKLAVTSASEELIYFAQKTSVDRGTLFTISIISSKQQTSRNKRALALQGS